MSVDKVAVVTLACCVLHNYCEITKQRIPMPANVRLQRDLLCWIPCKKDATSM